MKSSNRLLLIFGAAIGVLIITAVVLVLTIGEPGKAPLLPADTPEGTVQRYLLAVESENYLEAYGYLSSRDDNKLTYEVWGDPYIRSRDRPGWKATLGKSSVMGEEATVEVTIDVFRPSGPFDNPVQTNYTAFHLVEEDGSWKITDPFGLWIFRY
jgi:hypothetical protein